MKSNQFTVLLAEDDDDDAFLLSQALKELGICDVHRVSNGLEAICYLAGEGEYRLRSEHPLPDLLITDLNMPGANGLDLLAWVSLHWLHCRMATIMTSNMASSQQIETAYRLGLDFFVRKCFDFSELCTAVTRVRNHQGVTAR